RLLERVQAAFPEDNDVAPQPAPDRHPECESCEREGSGRADLSVPQILWVAEAPRRMTSGNRDFEIPAPYMPLPFSNTRALLKIEDGCTMRCAFCIIPRTRGPQRSRPPAEVVAEARELAAAGHQEIVVTGVQISAYRWEGRGLFHLVGDLLRDLL